MGKAFTVQLYFSYIRKNRWRDGKSPVEILTERSDVEMKVLKLSPIRLEKLLDLCQDGYPVPAPVTGYRKVLDIKRGDLYNAMKYFLILRNVEEVEIVPAYFDAVAVCACRYSST